MRPAAKKRLRYITTAILPLILYRFFRTSTSSTHDDIVDRYLRQGDCAGRHLPEHSNHAHVRLEDPAEPQAYV